MPEYTRKNIQSDKYRVGGAVSRNDRKHGYRLRASGSPVVPPVPPTIVSLLPVAFTPQYCECPTEAEMLVAGAAALPGDIIIYTSPSGKEFVADVYDNAGSIAVNLRDKEEIRNYEGCHIWEYPDKTCFPPGKRIRLVTPTSAYILKMGTDGEWINLGRDYEPSVNDPMTIDIGHIGYGVACVDSNTGQGFLMYSEEDVFTRFSASPPYSLAAKHVIAVLHDGTEWKYDRNSSLVPFTPASSDVLIAEIDFTAGSIQSLEGTFGDHLGITKGYACGDIEYFANQLNGSPNSGEYDLEGTFITLN